jgi:ATP-dependent protease ClpP protease subunit
MRLLLVLLGLLACVGAVGTPPRVLHLTGANAVFLSKEVSIESFDNDVAAVIGKRMMLDNKETLYIIVASVGGNPDAAVAIIRVLKSVPNAEILCIFCASAAALIFEGAGLHRLVKKDSQIVLHELFLQRFTAAMITKDILDDLKNSSDKFNHFFYPKLGMTKEAYEAKIKDFDWYLKGQEMVEKNLADEVVVIKCNEYLKRFATNTCKE